MAGDKYTALWVSHSSISDFLKCPRAYYLANIYRDPDTGHKVTLMNPHLALGQTVHAVLESLSHIPTSDRFKEPLLKIYDNLWEKVSGERGGFTGNEEEERYKNRGRSMIERAIKNPGPLNKLAVKIKMDLPHYWLSETDNIILCGRIDWLEYCPDTESVHIIDFKTGRHEEEGDSLQLPIYCLLVSNCQKRPVSKISYWYLDHNDNLSEKELPNLDESKEKVLKIAKSIKLAKALDRFKCSSPNGCPACQPYEMIVRGYAHKVGSNEFNADVYVATLPVTVSQEDSVIL